MLKQIVRLKLFLQYIYKDVIHKAILWIVAFLGFMQSIAPLVVRENITGGGMTWWEYVLAFFVTRWSWQLWAIVLLSVLTFILVRSLWNLGGFDLRIGLELRSEPLTDGERRFLGLNITNLSPKDIRQMFVRLDALRHLDDAGWSPNPLIQRKDRFMWTSWEPPRQGNKDLISGYQIIADLLVMQTGLNTAHFLLQAQTLYLHVPPGRYQAKISIVGVYSNRRFEIPACFEFTYSGEKVLTNLSASEDLDWRIDKPVGISVLPEPETHEFERLRADIDFNRGKGSS